MNYTNEHKKVYKSLPDNIKSILLVSEGWLVGGSINDLISGNKPNDYDIIVPDRGLFQNILKLIASRGPIEINSYGGIKFEENGVEIDIWPEELDHFIKNTKGSDFIYNYKVNILYKMS